MKRLFALLLIFSSVSFSGAETRPPVVSQTKPNIIFLLADDQTTYSMGCYGNPDVRTPHMDQLSRDGVTFDNHYVTTAICMASRGSILTGMYEYKTGCNFKHPGQNQDGDLTLAMWENTYPMLLREAGYLTAFAGKFGVNLMEEPGGSRLPLPEDDFDRWGGGPGQTSYDTKKNKSMAAYAEEYPHATLSYGAFGRDFIGFAAGEGKPFCLSISFKAPHRPTTPDPRFDHVYAGKVFKKPGNFGREAGEHFAKQSKQDRQYERFYSWNYADKYDEVMATYHQQVYGIDQALGMIREALEANGVADNTVIIYTSDNGFFCGSHGYGSKVLPYEESSRVPLIIYDPRHGNSGKQWRTEALTGNIDFAPTILALAGLPIPKSMDGKDLMPAYDDPETEIHETLALINVWGNSPTHAMAVVSRDWKYVYWGYAGPGFVETEELYYLGGDPLEMMPLVDNSEYRSQLNTMRASYDRHLAHWKAQAVDYHYYPEYAVIFDRNIPWDEKAPLIQPNPYQAGD